MDSLRNIPGGVVIATVIGVIDALIVWGIATLFDVSIQVPDDPGSQTLADLTIPPVIFIVAVSSIAAGILLWLLQRFVPNRALRVFQVVAIIVLVLSFGLPIGLDQPVEGQLSLVATHILVGAVIIATMTWVATKPTEEAEASETGGHESRGTD